MMRWLAIGVIALAAIWCGWWIVGSAAISRGLDGAAEQARGRGWHVEWDGMSVAGFPNRFDTTLTAPVVAPPGSEWTWRTPFLQVFALSYRPNHLIAVVADTQTLNGPAGAVEIASEDMRASVVASPDMSMALRRATATVETLSVTFAAGALEVDAGRAALREAAGTSYDVAFGGRGIVLPARWLDGIELDDTMPRKIAELSMDAQLRLDRVLDRTLDAPPVLEAVELRALRLDWGAVGATVSGAVEAGSDGLANGSLVLELDDLDATIAALRGALDAAQLEFGRRFLAGFAIDGRPGAIRIELPVTEGVVVLGPVPLLALPPLHVAEDQGAG